MNAIFIGLGSNLGNRKKNLKKAIREIGATAEIKLEKTSSIIETKPHNAPGPNYLNCTIKIKTDLLPEILLEKLQNIEKKLGRKRSFKNAPRIIDLDILIYGNKKISTKQLVIPHPEIKNRGFIKKSLFEIEPKLTEYFL